MDYSCSGPKIRGNSYYSSIGNSSSAELQPAVALISKSVGKYVS